MNNVFDSALGALSGVDSFFGEQGADFTCRQDAGQRLADQDDHPAHHERGAAAHRVRRHRAAGL